MSTSRTLPFPSATCDQARTGSAAYPQRERVEGSRRPQAEQTGYSSLPLGYLVRFSKLQAMFRVPVGFFPNRDRMNSDLATW